MTDPTSASSSASERRARPPGRHALLPMWIALLVLAVLAAAGGWYLTQRITALDEALASRALATERQMIETQGASHQAAELVRQLDHQITELNARLADAQGRQQALDRTVADLTQNRDDWTLAEIEQTLSAASQQLQLTGNVALALGALQNADQRLASAAGPAAISVRRALAQDMDRLRAAPAVDISGLAIRLDNVIAQTGTLPLAGEAAVRAAPVAQPGTAPSPASVAHTAVADWPARAGAWIKGLGAESLDRLRGLVQVRRIDNADAYLASPEQSYFLRENLKLRLLSARVALLARDHALLASDLKAARAEIDRYFDGDAGPVRQARAELDAIDAGAVGVAPPTLDESLQTLRQFRKRG
jgi:uroporphyrinogen III methyltransferase/synthase